MVPDEKMSAMYLNHANAWCSCIFTNADLTWSMNVHPYGGANLVTKAVAEVRCLTSPLHLKELFWSINLANLIRLSVKICLDSLLLWLLLMPSNQAHAAD